VSAWSRFRRFRREGSPYVLVFLYVLVTAAALGWLALVPGDPTYANGGVGATVVMTAVLVGFVLVRSYLAWWIAIFFAALSAVIWPIVALVTATEPQPQIGDAGKAGVLAVLYAAALVLLLSPAIEDWLEADRRRTRQATEPHGG
jgi:hypothetical protein